MSAFFQYVPWLFIILVPAVSMRLWAEERKSGTIELLLTMPVTVAEAVLGKFIAASLFLGVALACTFPMPVTVLWLGSPDLGPIFLGIIRNFFSWPVLFYQSECFFQVSQKIKWSHLF